MDDQVYRILTVDLFLEVLFVILYLKLYFPTSKDLTQPQNQTKIS